MVCENAKNFNVLEILYELGLMFALINEEGFGVYMPQSNRYIVTA